jgi:hypothetical protein
MEIIDPLNKKYKSFEEAEKYHNIFKDEMYIKIIDHPRSVERYTHNYQYLYVMGIGPRLYPGYPKNNQMWNNQNKFLNVFQNHNHIKVFRQFEDGDVIYIGNYVFMNYKKKIVETGFTYFEFELKRKFNLFDF